MLRILSVIAFLILFLTATVFLLLLTNDRSSILTANLPSSVDEHRKAFERNVDENFSSKYSTEELRVELSAIGFEVNNGYAEFVNQRFFYFCPTTYLVSWEPRDSGTVEVVESFVHFTC
jgi:hypothetical protein